MGKSAGSTGWRRAALAAAMALAVALPLQRAHAAPPDPARICSLILREALLNDLPPEFLTRLLWKESRFRPDAVSPKGALGIAQFMPATAKLRGLDDPRDPFDAIPASAAYLAELGRTFGNLGLAAAAYNAGEERVRQWLGGKATLPAETLDYVHAITGRPAGWFRFRGVQVEPHPLDPRFTFRQACDGLAEGAAQGILFRKPSGSGWTVQVAGHADRDTALALFQRIEPASAQMIAGSGNALIRSRELPPKAPFWSVEVPAGNEQAAIGLCSRLLARGTSCVVWSG